MVSIPYGKGKGVSDWVSKSFSVLKYQFPMGKVKLIRVSRVRAPDGAPEKCVLKYQFPMGKVKLKKLRSSLKGLYPSLSINSLWER